MQALVVGCAAVGMWAAVLLIVLAFCRAAKAGDEAQSAGRERRSELRLIAQPPRASQPPSTESAAVPASLMRRTT
jgi:hypothetical protein